MIRHIVAFFLVGLRPLLGPASCYYTESCMPFSLRQLKENSLIPALFYIVKRLVSCNPVSNYFNQNRLGMHGRRNTYLVCL